MSSEVYARGLWRHGNSLTIKDGDLTVQLRSSKTLGAIPEAEIDFGEVELGTLAYPPEVREKEGERRREMEAPEIVALKARIAKLSAAFMRVLSAKPKKPQS